MTKLRSEKQEEWDRRELAQAPFFSVFFLSKKSGTAGNSPKCIYVYICIHTHTHNMGGGGMPLPILCVKKKKQEVWDRRELARHPCGKVLYSGTILFIFIIIYCCRVGPPGTRPGTHAENYSTELYCT
jgi:hypothetical protein